MLAWPGARLAGVLSVIFLLSHGIELTVKAYLRHSGLTVEELGKIGHDLQALYAQS